MGYTPHMIADIRTGLQRNVTPFLAADDAFPTLENAYLWRGRIYKKGGNVLLGRLGARAETLAIRGVGNTHIATNLFYTPIEPGSIVITDLVTTFTDDGVGGFIITGGTGTVNAPTNYTTGAIDITFTTANLGAVVAAFYLLVVGNTSPVMGLRTRDILNTSTESLIAFDLLKAYEYNSTLAKFININFYKGTVNEFNWTGSNSDFFFTTNYQNAFFATNNTIGGNFYIITAITNAASAVITIGAHNFQTGDTVYINNVIGMTQINNLTGTITAIGATTITVNINSTAFGVYVSGGVVWSSTLSKAGVGDGIKWYDGTGWVNFEPPIDATGTPTIIQAALIILPYKDRLVMLNTVEGPMPGSATRFPQRARYSQNGNVFYQPPVPAGIAAVPSGQEWYEIPGRGGFIDATTQEDIIAAEFIKDVLIVYFERSTWRLVFTGNFVQPFIWEKINTEIGAESTFSTVPFDKEILSVGPNGIYQCNSVDVERIDRIIPDEVFNFENGNNGRERVYGIRDFFSEMSFWTYGDSAFSSIFPNRTLVYNYLDTAWAIFENSYTCFGYFQTFSDVTWATAVNPWDSYDVPWNSFQDQSDYPIIVAGNQEGFVFKLQESDGSFPPTNDTSLVIQNITNANPSVFTSPNHNMQEGQFMKITNVGGIPSLNGNIFIINTVLSANTYTIRDAIAPISVSGYTFGGFVTLQDNFNITTKSLNPFYESGVTARIGYVDFYVDATETSEATVQLFIDDDISVPVESYTLPLVDPFNALSQRFWTRVFFFSEASFIQIKITYSDIQMFNQDITSEEFILQAINIWMSPSGRIVI